MDDATLNPVPDARQEHEHDLLQIVELLAAKLGQPDGDPVALDGGITNRNYRACLGGRDYVIRVPGKDTSLLGIDREAERAANECAAAVGVAPAVAAFIADPACIVTLFAAGRGADPAALREPETLKLVATTLSTIHTRCAPLASTFDSFRIVEAYAAVAVERTGEEPRFEEAHQRAALIEAALAGPEHEPVPCHNDLLAGNFIIDGDHLWIVDWEYAGMGDRYFDLANFSVNNELEGEAEEELLATYFGAPPAPAQIASLRLMRFMSDFREAMWGVVQGSVSELEFDFAAYADRHFDRLRETASDPRFEGWLEDCRAAG
jgi:aminoglycoside phosphotransferase (APT) family kinase protein